MKRFFRTILILAVIVAALGFFLSSRGYNIPFFSKPENAVQDFMKQENLMEFLSRYEEYMEEPDEVDDGSQIWIEIFSSPEMKSFFLDNIRSVSYNITNVSQNGNKATVTAMITHLDIAPVIDRTFKLWVDEILKLASSGAESFENEDFQTKVLYPLLQKSFKEAATKTKPTETYSTVKFKCVKDEIWIWELEEVPDAFYDKVLSMNMEQAVDNAYDTYVSTLPE